MANTTMNGLAWLRKHLKEADVDLLREIVTEFVSVLMDAEVSAICGAGYKERSRSGRIVGTAIEKELGTPEPAQSSL